MSGDNSFFVELQMEFLNESAFLLETYEESMMSLETGAKPGDDLSQIFRVAHSIKGGAAAVGLGDLAKFAHVVEDLLAVLRSNPELVNSNIVSLLLQSGDEFKKRIHSLQQGQDLPWDTSALVAQLLQTLESVTGGKAGSHDCPAEGAPKEDAPDDFFANPATPSAEASNEDNTNHDLLAELLGQLSPEDRAEYEAKEVAAVSIPAPAAEAKPKATPTLVETAKPKVVAEETKAPAASTKIPAGASKNQNVVIKVDTGRVDSVLDAVGELVVLKNQIVHDDYIRSGGNVRLEAIVDQLDKAVRELYEKTLSIRMTPLKSLFIKIQRIVRDVSITLNKPVDLQLIGEETEVERTVFELLGDPLVHMVRNSMDHGVEKAEVRAERGKPATAKVTVAAKQSGGNVIIDITDDGGGISRDRILAKATEKGLIPASVDPSTLSDDQVFQFIFAPGFSTAEKVTDLSGRGVGLDVVRSNLDRINGKINIMSKLGHGTTFRLTIPLSTAITDGIVVALEGERYIMPIHSIREIVRVMPKDYTEIPRTGKVAKIREILVPVIDIDTTLGEITRDINNRREDSEWNKRKTDSLAARREETMLVIIESVNGQMALPVDDVLGQAQVVVKPIAMGQSIPEVAGAAILGDGRTVLILDPTTIVAKAARGPEVSSSSSSAMKEAA